MGRSSTVIGKCEACQTAIFEDHPYAWCDRCGAPLPGTVKAALPALREPPRPRRKAGVPLTVAGRDVSCPICQHDRFLTSEKLVPGPAAAFFGMWGSATASTFVCVNCRHMLWFMR